MSKKRNYKVYVHINKSNGKRYYGITSLKVEKRWNNGKGYKKNEHFWNAIQKYGWNEGFEHIVVAKGLTEDEAKWLEIELIKEHDTTNQDKGYNISLGGESGNHTEETRKKISEGMKRHEVTEETRKKISEGMKGKNHPRATKVYCIELDMYFNTVTEASEYVGCDRSSISKALIGKRKTCGGYHWLYAKDKLDKDKLAS